MEKNNTKDTKKCAHPACSCSAKEGSLYCSTFCAGVGETPDVECKCGHAGCAEK